MNECEFLCIAGDDKVYLPCVNESQGWDLKVTGNWKIDCRGLMKDFLSRLFHIDDSETEWYSENEIRFFSGPKGKT